MKKFHFCFFIITGLFAFLFVLFVAIIFVPQNPIKIRYSIFNSEQVKRITPQGWSFFTKSPRDADFRIFKLDKTTGNFVEVTLVNSQISQLFGAKRDNRIIHTQINTIASQVEGEIWYKYRGPLDSILTKGSYEKKLNKINLNVSKSFLCGQYVIQESKPIPWAWSVKENIFPPSKFLLFNFQCSTN